MSDDEREEIVLMEDNELSMSKKKKVPKSATQWWQADLNHLDCFHGRLDKKHANVFLTLDGDFLVRVARDRRDRLIKPVLSVKWKEKTYHYLIRDHFGLLLYIHDQEFTSIQSLVSFHYMNKIPIVNKSEAPILLRPICPKKKVPDTTYYFDSPTTSIQSTPLLGKSARSLIDVKLPQVLVRLIFCTIFALFIIFLYACIRSDRNVEHS